MGLWSEGCRFYPFSEYFLHCNYLTQLCFWLSKKVVGIFKFIHVLHLMENSKLFLVTSRSQSWDWAKTLFVTREIFPCIWGNQSGKSFPLYGFAPDPFTTSAENFPNFFSVYDAYLWSVKAQFCYLPCMLSNPCWRLAHTLVSEAVEIFAWCQYCPE